MLKDQVLLPKTGFYKANLHSHTVVSDGRFTPEEAKAAYQKEGYSIVAFTDHRKYVWHKELDSEDFLALAAVEVDLTEQGKDWPVSKTYHLNLFDTAPSPRREELDLLPHFAYDDKEALNQYIARMNELGFLVCYNHPYWSLQNYDDYKDLRGLFAMEIYNHGCEVEGLYGFNPQSYDEMLRAGQRLCALATDDNHNAYPLNGPEGDSFGGFVQIAAQRLDYPSVIQALRENRFYWSMGPQLKGVEIQDGLLKIHSSPVEKIFVKLENRNYYRKQVLPGESLEYAEFPLTGKEGWLRVEVKDSRGLLAGTSAFFIDQLAAD